MNFANTIASKTMNIDLSAMPGSTKSLDELCIDIFIIVTKMHEHADLGTPEALRKLLTDYLRLFENNCRSSRIDTVTIEAAKFALVALIDETVLSIPGECAEYWLSKPLQYEFWGESIAGERFYETIQILLHDPERNIDVLEIYYLCLALGFAGKHLDNPDEREKIITDLAKVLVKVRKTRIPEKKISLPVVTKRSGSLTLPLWIIATAAGAIIGIGVISSWVSTTVHAKHTIKAIEATIAGERR